jgi:predicted  nucleic acid-binding Zn-ribbon protein
VRLPVAVNKANRALTEVQRMQPQTSSMELRLEELRQAIDTRLDPGTPEEQAEARRLLDEVRREHEQIRARMTAISWYEDRLRRLEEQAVPADGTAR